jgi:hypothetical protein
MICLATNSTKAEAMTGGAQEKYTLSAFVEHILCVNHLTIESIIRDDVGLAL